ncbi:uncharacterized protein H6S33_007466 [Morchella sextelata]|uniref:uncharacterized protein n=1 Tax=Morchella sextelata TaxID=1174677 RepID=UPI001D036D6C|nr:uncharacterized protein H6S33_007466 [Morchella sextelata]KAH0603807.1 hypothetical protein H6S33_007466 [Morchella sextelata]
MANLSDEDSQMHDSPSSTPSTPPLSQPHTHNLVNPAEHLSLHSPPDSQGQGQGPGPQGYQQQGQGQSSQQQMGVGVGVGVGVVPSWATKRAVEDAETAREKVVDGKFTLRWVGDDYDESDMFKTD